MVDKAYAILLHSEDEDNGYLYFPIKRNNLVYGGMPQFFGGTKNAGESDHDTIAREMYEESDGKVTLGPGGLSSVYKSRVGNNNYAFYVAENYEGTNFLGSLTNSEMSSIQQFFVQVGQQDDVEDLLKSLKIVPTEEFAASETYMAFNRAIAWSEK